MKYIVFLFLISSILNLTKFKEDDIIVFTLTANLQHDYFNLNRQKETHTLGEIQMFFGIDKVKGHVTIYPLLTQNQAKKLGLSIDNWLPGIKRQVFEIDMDVINSTPLSLTLFNFNVGKSSASFYTFTELKPFNLKNNRNVFVGEFVVKLKSQLLPKEATIYDFDNNVFEGIITQKIQTRKERLITLFDNLKKDFNMATLNEFKALLYIPNNIDILAHIVDIENSIRASAQEFVQRSTLVTQNLPKFSLDSLKSYSDLYNFCSYRKGENLVKKEKSKYYSDFDHLTNNFIRELTDLIYKEHEKLRYYNCDKVIDIVSSYFKGYEEEFIASHNRDDFETAIFSIANLIISRQVKLLTGQPVEDIISCKNKAEFLKTATRAFEIDELTQSEEEPSYPDGHDEVVSFSGHKNVQANESNKRTKGISKLKRTMSYIPVIRQFSHSSIDSKKRKNAIIIDDFGKFYTTLVEQANKTSAHFKFCRKKFIESLYESSKEFSNKDIDLLVLSFKSFEDKRLKVDLNCVSDYERNNSDEIFGQPFYLDDDPSPLIGSN
jgi:hypothetical protein